MTDEWSGSMGDVCGGGGGGLADRSFVGGAMRALVAGSGSVVSARLVYKQTAALVLRSGSCWLHELAAGGRSAGMSSRVW